MTGAFGPEQYLRSGADQNRLLDAMATRHAWEKHGKNAGVPSHTFRKQAQDHLREASIGVAVFDKSGQPRYLLAHPRSGQVAWITPHKEHRSTLFSPDQGAELYTRLTVAGTVSGHWRFLDLPQLRAAPTRVRAAARVSGRSRGPELGR